MLGLWLFHVLSQRLDLILNVFYNINFSVILYVKVNKHEVGCSFKGNTWGGEWRGIDMFVHEYWSAIERMYKNTSLQELAAHDFVLSVCSIENKYMDICIWKFPPALKIQGF